MHKDLLSDVWLLTQQREDVEQMLAYVTTLQHQAIALSSAHGVSRKDLAELSGFSGPRITQIVDATDVNGLDLAAIHDASRQLEERPDRVIDAANADRRRRAHEDPEAPVRERRLFAIIHGEESAARRYGPASST